LHADIPQRRRGSKASDPDPGGLGNWREDTYIGPEKAAYMTVSEASISPSTPLPLKVTLPVPATTTTTTTKRTNIVTPSRDVTKWEGHAPPRTYICC